VALPGAYSSATIALWVTGAHKPLHYKVAVLEEVQISSRYEILLKNCMRKTNILGLVKNLLDHGDFLGAETEIFYQGWPRGPGPNDILPSCMKSGFVIFHLEWHKNNLIYFKFVYILYCMKMSLKISRESAQVARSA
jgi:hypothetical protein